MGSRRATFIKDLLKLLHVSEIVDEARVLLVFESAFNFSVTLPEEHYTLLLARLVVILFDHVELLLHLLFKVFTEFLSDISNSYFIEMIESLFFAGSVYIFKFIVIKRSTRRKLLSESFLEYVKRVILGFKALVLADVGP